MVKDDDTVNDILQDTYIKAFARLDQLPDKKWLKGKNLLGAFFYDEQDQRMKIQPLSILTDTGVGRLLY